MDRFLKLVLYAIPVLAFAGLIFFVFNPQLADTGTRGLLKDSIRAGGEFPCPQFESIRESILSGGPPKDGIPAISDAKYISAAEATLADSDRVYGIAFNGFIAAYPEDIMVWHEIVNQLVDEQMVSISYCPLTRSAIGFVGYNLGVSGKLYNSNLIMYDRKTHSQVPQILGVAIDGELCGTELPTFPVKATTWGEWKTRHKETVVMTTETGYRREYGRGPYGDYYETETVLFPLTETSDELPGKSMVLGLSNSGESAAIPYEGFLTKYPEGLSFMLGGRPVTVWYDTDYNILRADSEIRHMSVFWFAWFAQHPNTVIKQ